MKKIILALFAVLLTTSIALAAWQDTFSTDFAKDSVASVKNILAQGGSPAEIVASADGIDPAKLVTAMCDAGLTPQDLQGVLTQLGKSANEVMSLCGLDNISFERQFPGSSTEIRNSLSVNVGTNYDGDGTLLDSTGGAVAGAVGGGATPIPPASVSRP